MSERGLPPQNDPRDETRERFLGAIADRLPATSIAEAHVFQPIRQGGTESGVAVLAVEEQEAGDHDRLAVYTARYRLALRGPDRGKFEFTMQAEADAPLITVARVVQGVQRRVGDAEAPVRFSGEEFRALLGATD